MMKKINMIEKMELKNKDEIMKEIKDWKKESREWRESLMSSIHIKQSSQSKPPTTRHNTQH